MFKHIKTALSTVARTYADPGAGVTVYSTPDSLLDFYRLDGAFLPFTRRKTSEQTDKRAARPASDATRPSAPSSRLGAPCTDC
jgi:hypothetical protein